MNTTKYFKVKIVYFIKELMSCIYTRYRPKYLKILSSCFLSLLTWSLWLIHTISGVGNSSPRAVTCPCKGNLCTIIYDILMSFIAKWPSIKYCLTVKIYLKECPRDFICPRFLATWYLKALQQQQASFRND